MVISKYWVKKYEFDKDPILTNFSESTKNVNKTWYIKFLRVAFSDNYIQSFGYPPTFNPS